VVDGANPGRWLIVPAGTAVKTVAAQLGIHSSDSVADQSAA